MTLGTFVYNPKYLRRPDAVPLEPCELGLRPGPVETVKLGGIFGALRDATPDAWGRRIIERHLRRSDVSEAEFLLHSPDDRVGASRFHLRFGFEASPARAQQWLLRLKDAHRLLVPPASAPPQPPLVRQKPLVRGAQPRFERNRRLPAECP